MKKCICIILAIVMLVAAGITALAANKPLFTVETVKTGVEENDTVTIGVDLSNNSGLAQITLGIKYDKSKLKLIGYENSALTGWVVGVGTANESAVWFANDNQKINGEILKLKFQVVNGAPAGKAEVFLEAEAFATDGGEETEVLCEVVSGGITVKGVCKHVNTEVRNEKAATCAAEGYTGDTYCKDCKELVKKGEATPKNPQNHIGETEIKNEKKANCVEKGYTGDTYCKGCGVKLSDGKETAIDPNNHKEIEVINKKEANCKDAGYTGDTHCKACDTIIAKGTEIAKNENHKFGAWKITKEATKDAEGVKERTCSICNKVETVKIPRLSDNTEPIHISANGESKGEKNPNTGAESAIGVVALAAVCTGAYIVGKKHR